MNENDRKKSLEEFLGEAQELTDTLSGKLMSIHQSLKSGERFEPQDINAAFRAIHTIKGLSSLFNVESIASLAHNMEEIFDGLRMGRIQPDGNLLDLLFEGVELFQQMMGALAEDRPMDINRVKSLMERLQQKTDKSSSIDSSTVSDFDIMPDVLAVLTEYEEHRLKESIVQNKNLCFISASFALTTIEKDLETIKERLQEHGEIITYLPSSHTEDESLIELDILLATDESISFISELVQELGSNSRVAAVTKKNTTTISTQDNQSTVGEEYLQHTEEISQTSLRSVTQTVRVDIRRLDNLMNLLGEISVLFGQVDELSKAMKEESERSATLRDSSRILRLVKRRLDELQEGILEVRMVPLEQLFDKLSRIVRKMSREAGKPVEFFVTGGDTELDKLIVEELSDPLMHIIRNCMDHGIEETDKRIRKEKRPEGLIALRAYQKGSHVIIEIEDDGVGISREKVLKTAITRNIIDDKTAEEMSDREILNLIFRPGFSTRESAGSNSGRGVGMDVVKTNIAKLSGLIDIQSRDDIGTKFILTLPITLAILRALIVRVADQLYAVPLNSVLEALAVTKNQISTIEGREVLSIRGITFPLLRLSDLFGIPDAEDSDRVFVIVVGMAQHRVGLVVNELKNQQDIVIKSLGKALSSIPGIAGATELGTQRVILVLDIASLVNDTLITTAERSSMQQQQTSNQ